MGRLKPNRTRFLTFTAIGIRVRIITPAHWNIAGVAFNVAESGVPLRSKKPGAQKRIRNRAWGTFVVKPPQTIPVLDRIRKRWIIANVTQLVQVVCIILALNAPLLVMTPTTVDRGNRETRNTPAIILSTRSHIVVPLITHSILSQAT